MLQVARAGDRGEKHSETQDQPQSPAGQSGCLQAGWAHWEPGGESAFGIGKTHRLHHEEEDQEKGPSLEIVEHGFQGKASEGDGGGEQEGEEHQGLFIHTQEGKGGQGQGNEFAAGIPVVQGRLAGKIVKD